MNVLVTGSNGFVGKNLCAALGAQSDVTVRGYDWDSEPDALPQMTADCDFVFHLAGVTRPHDTSELAQNFSAALYLTDCLNQNHNRAPIVFASSVRAQYDTPYGQCLREIERVLLEYGKQSGALVLIYRLCSVFGRWCRPCYNSPVATMCDAAANGRVLPIADPDAVIRLVYIDDVTNEFLRVLYTHGDTASGIYPVLPVSSVSAGWLACRIAAFATGQPVLRDLGTQNALLKKLYDTYISYLP